MTALRRRQIDADAMEVPQLEPGFVPVNALRCQIAGAIVAASSGCQATAARKVQDFAASLLVEVQIEQRKHARRDS